ncbi:MAG: type II toxin-antitoxin system RelE/ParE family toxin [Deltaproteobacteria bacterium]|nr:type II toxin-antitoxin system RelE/ParE family toxin [Deltaproteobacteria bacterium]
MTRRLLVRPQVETDIDSAAAWYEDQEAGLGGEFVEGMRLLINRIHRNPMAYQEIDRRVRRAIHGRFPYGGYFVVTDEAVIILAVLHLRRKPGAWRSR